MPLTHTASIYKSLPLVLMLALLTTDKAPALELSETPASPKDWGYRPAHGDTLPVNPPRFTWRPQTQIQSWILECAEDREFKKPIYRRENIILNVHCPPEPFTAQSFHWRYRGVSKDGEQTPWSQTRQARFAAQPQIMPMPTRPELRRRIPQTHPRLFTRPENIPHLRKLAETTMADRFREMTNYCDSLLASPPSTKEPPLYPANTVRGSDPWRKIWWGNRTRVISVLRPASELAFTRLLGGKEEYGQLAKRLLLQCAQWDPKGATGYRYNDEAGMPYAYYFSRTYSFVHDLLTEEEREECRQVMRIRGDEMYNHLYPRHLWSPYSSHSNRAWHFLGEVAIAFHGEIPEADDWLWFAMNVFFNVYPVWSDADGGWHEGSSYWTSYITRFTWWADIMRAATGVNAYDKPYFSKLGYYAMYLMPPGKTGGGFGDLTADKNAESFRAIMTIFAAQAANPYWQWWVDQVGGPALSDGYIGFIRGAMPAVQSRTPHALPASRLFRGIGQAMLNNTILGGPDNVQITFKSSPFGTQSHGYEANNSFLLWAYGERLLIRSGRRDSYGSEHHSQWMWSTRSVNNITVNGLGQHSRSPLAKGRITTFKTSPQADVVAGEAAEAYVDKNGNPILDLYERVIIFIKPEIIIIRDRLIAKEDAVFEYWLHAINRFDARNQLDITTQNKNAAVDIAIHTPAQLSLRQTNQYDPNPRPRVSLREWHLTATTKHKTRHAEFLTVMRARRAGDQTRPEVTHTDLDAGHALKITLAPNHEWTVLIPDTDRSELKAFGADTTGAIRVTAAPTSQDASTDATEFTAPLNEIEQPNSSTQ